MERSEWVWREVWSQATAEDAPDDVVRLAAMVGIVRATRARRGELVRMQLSDHAPVRRKLMVRVTKFQQVTTVDVDDDLHRVLGEWRTRRRRLVAELEGAPHDAMFVTCHHTMWRGVEGQVTKQVGLPLSEQGLLLGWRRWAQRTNAERAGAFGWEPLPTRFESIRGGWRHR
ncbi:tyrosine-type recombinase/integrase [Streptomyces sp. cg35]|uniref:tyrosine-type recombinase/integrase n=1 Tax=Streptomyces sp. cg35 TaxID=3421650 RepID=UPI003D181662